MAVSETAPIPSTLRSRLLLGFAPGDLKTILSAAKQRHFPRNSVVASQGNPADHLYLLLNGRARMFFNTSDGKKIMLLWLTPGEIFGGPAILPNPCSYLVSTETLKDTVMLAWDRASLRDLGTRYPRLLENAALIGYNFLAWYVADHVALTTNDARQRLARVLVCLAETIGDKVADGFEFDATNEELAGAANVTPFTASRLLSEWQTNHAVVKRRGKILLRSSERLFLHSAKPDTPSRCPRS